MQGHKIVFLLVGAITVSGAIVGYAKPGKDDRAQDQPATDSFSITSAKHGLCDNIMRTGMIAEGLETLCKFRGGAHDLALAVYARENCGKVLFTSEVNKAAVEVLSGMRNEYAQMGATSFCKDAASNYAYELRDLRQVK